jgi:hypothetical protein
MLVALVVWSASAEAQQPPALRGCQDLKEATGLVWSGTERRMTLQQVVSYAAPVFWLSPDEPTAKNKRGRDLRVPAALPFESQPESPVIYYQLNGVGELPDADGPGFMADPADPGNAVLDIGSLSALNLKYIAYFPEEAGVGRHLHDVEPTEFRLLVGRSNGELARSLGFFCDEEFYLVVVVRVTGEAHGNRWYYNVMDVDRETFLPVHVLVEEGKHATATDRNADGYYTPGYDVSVRPNDAWGVRDTIRGGTLFTGKFESWMAKVRRPEHRVLPPLPPDSMLRDRLAEEGIDPAVNAVYELRPFPSSELAVDDALLKHKMEEKEVPGWPVVDRPEELLAPLEEFFAEGLQLKPYSVAFRYDGDPGISVAFPFFFVKNLNEPLSGGYIVHRVYVEGDNLHNWGWLFMYTPSASRWFDQYFAGGMETSRIRNDDGSLTRERKFVFETGVKFRFRAPNKAFSWMTNFWGLRAGIKNVGAWDIKNLTYVIELGAGVW